MAFTEVGHDDCLALGYRSVCADELTFLAHRVDLVQRQLVLQACHTSAATL